MCKNLNEEKILRLHDEMNKLKYILNKKMVKIFEERYENKCKNKNSEGRERRDYLSFVI